MITSLAHTAVHVQDVDAAVAWYRDVLGLTVLSPPYTMEGDGIARDMERLVPPPVVVRAAIMGFDADGDRVLEVIEYPNARIAEPGNPSVLTPGYTHVGLLCDDVVETRRELEARGVAFLVPAYAELAGLRTTWFADPWRNVFILVEKIRRPDHPYYRQY